VHRWRQGHQANVNSESPRLDIPEGYDTSFIPFLFFRAQKKKTNPKEKSTNGCRLKEVPSLSKKCSGKRYFLAGKKLYPSIL